MRHRILMLLAGFSFTAYPLRINISVAQQFTVPELGLTDIQVGQKLGAFMPGYALFLVPVLIHFWGWAVALASGFVPAIAGAVSWLLIRSRSGLSELSAITRAEAVECLA